MNRKHISQAAILIKADTTKVWQALIDPEIAKSYFFGAKITTNWNIGDEIIFEGEYNGNKYFEKGEILNVEEHVRLQYSHWSNLENLPDIPENYRIWTFNLAEAQGGTKLTVTEDNIPSEHQKQRSDEFWQGVLSTIKSLTSENP